MADSTEAAVRRRNASYSIEEKLASFSDVLDILDASFVDVSFIVGDGRIKT